MTMAPWYKIVTPRKEVREGRSFSPDEFAIALEQVVSKSSAAPEDYHNPEQLFSRTYFTRAIKDHAGSRLPLDAVECIMDNLPMIRRKDEKKYDDGYRTKRVILEIYEAMHEFIRSGQPYQTRLDPPPADPRCCHPARELQSVER